MSAQAGSDDDALITGINVTPLVDVALVLLVILMVTATYIAARTIPLELPQAATGEASAPTLAISIDTRGQTWLDGKAVTHAELRRALGTHSARQSRAIIAADGGTAHRHVVGVIDLLRHEGITQFAINVQPGELSGGD